jgi:hypothetical protein
MSQGDEQMTMNKPSNSPVTGTWTYRSLRSNPDLSAPFNALEFARANLRIEAGTLGEMKGRIYGTGWELKIKGSLTYGNPLELRFQARGMVGSEEWIYDYVGYLVKPWPNGEGQVPAIVGSIVRTVPHSDGKGGIAPAGEVAQWIAVRQPDRD